MKEHIQNLADDELLEMQDQHRHALMHAMFDGNEWSDLHHELSLIERELHRRDRRAA